MRKTSIWLAAVVVTLTVLAGVPGAQQPVPPAQPAPPASPPTTPPSSQPAPVPAAKAAPQQVLRPETQEQINRISKGVEAAEKSIQQLREVESELTRVRAEVERIIYDSTATAEELRPQLAEVKGLLDKLGPPPKAGEPAESETVAAERARLNALASAYSDGIKTAEIAWGKAKAVIDKITVYRYQNFTRNLLERRESPLSPSMWRDVVDRFDAVVGRLHYYGGDWLGWAGRRAKGLLAVALISILAGIGLTLLAMRVQVRALVRPDGPKSPSFVERVAKAAWIAPLRMVAPAAVAIIVYLGFDELDLMFSPWTNLGTTIFKGALIFAAAAALLTTTLAPRHPWWRLVPVADGTAWRLSAAFHAFVGVYVLDIILVELLRVLYAPLAITAAETFIISLLFAAILITLLVTRFVPQTGPDRPVNGHEFVAGRITRFTPPWVKLPLWLVGLTIIGSSLLGYVALGRFVAHQLVLSGMIVATAWLLYLAIRSFTRGRDDRTSPAGALLERHFGIEGPRRQQISRFVEATATLVVTLLALPLVMLQWGFSADDIRGWFMALLFGFEIGQFKISLFRILIGIALFAGLLFVTRMMQRWLRERVMTEQKIDPGIANSIDIAVGYLGTAMSLLVAVSYAGFDVTNLAIVASALAVGVGFGLQSIVNNFVSGLILLVERPIKVGDWIVVGDQQGNVRRISVRATEIETFDRASLIIPNSELISNRVLNWTHRNQLGRQAVKITVGPGNDPERVMRLLRAAADSHPDAVRQPPPSVTFDGFSETGLEFTVRVTVADVYRGGAVATDLRIAILHILREQGMMHAAVTPVAEGKAKPAKG